ncbi:hypothetical protein BDK51DRAFT_26238 [Blyttiomyces helicus]|uniref:Uncharacterized protein n=1 Tax=Blyttiomyces helicus TaxID=388810 RepID=A0A4P9W2D0_9FUNG|nr:hypothetical protein BDK51DRAFT_26238 [Blyttiomyces helicus]|eukprot:RKO86399.1 hypothetical protein BDK51DRAFT_26238 [Blyttiomyces helicus]
MPHNAYRTINLDCPAAKADIFRHEESATDYVVVYSPIMVTDQCEPLYQGQTTATIDIIATPSTIARRTSASMVPHSFSLGSISIAGIPTHGDRSVTVKIYFGLTELTVLAVVNATGVEKRIGLKASYVTQ